MQARQLTAAGDYMAIHFDARAPRADYDRIRAELADNPSVTFARRRIKCGWGEWSLVQATLNAVEAALEAFPRATHFYMVSGDCMAIKSAKFAHGLLDADDADYIESFDFFESDWIKTGFKEERLHYRHVFNERTRKRLFYASFRLQQRLGITREVPADIQVMIGSQWWCLRRRTIESILGFARARRDVVRFFRTTWIPDETFFQTLVRHLIPDNEIRCRTLTFLMFTDYGLPVTLHNDHYDLLLSQDFLFARKISPEAKELKNRLGALYASEQTDFRISNEGRSLFRFLTSRGRIGRRFAPRFWEVEASMGVDRELLIVACKKWHVAKRLVEAIRAQSKVPSIDYLFHEENTPLPDLGGIQTTLAKRARHRRSMMRMLFDNYGTDRLLICLDTSALDFMLDFYADRCVTRLLEIECRFNDDYLIGHARRIGLAGPDSTPEMLAGLLPTLRHDITFEVDSMRDAGLAHHHRLREGADVAANAAAISSFLGLGEDAARRLALTPGLFAD